MQEAANYPENAVAIERMSGAVLAWGADAEEVAGERKARCVMINSSDKDVRAMASATRNNDAAEYYRAMRAWFLPRATTLLNDTPVTDENAATLDRMHWFLQSVQESEELNDTLLDTCFNPLLYPSATNR